MGTYVNNGIVALTSPFDYDDAVREVAALVGVGARTDGRIYLADVCISPKIKMWAKNKPIYSSSFHLTDEEREQLNYGLVIVDGTTIEYRKPIGGAESLYRLGDFNGYNHNIKSPLGWQVTNSDETGGLYLIMRLADKTTQDYVADYRLMPIFNRKVVYDAQGRPTGYEDAKYEIRAYNSNDGWVVLQRGNVKDMPSAQFLQTSKLIGEYFVYMMMDNYQTDLYTHPEFSPNIEQAFENVLIANISPNYKVITSFGKTTGAISPADANLTEKELSKYTKDNPLVVDLYFQCSFTLNQNNVGFTLNNDTFRIAVSYTDDNGNEIEEYLPLKRSDEGVWNGNWSQSASSGIWAWRVDFSNSNLPKNKAINVKMWAVSREFTTQSWSRVSTQPIANTYIKIL